MITKGHTIQVLDHGFVRYVDHMGTDMDIVRAARVSYNAEDRGEDKDKKLLEYLWKNKHSSPFETVKLKLDVKLPIFIARQWIRHRMQNINEVSARYTELPNEFYIPKEWREQDIKNKQGSAEIIDTNRNLSATAIVTHHCQESYRLYQTMLDHGIAREMARMILPLNIYTHWISCWDMKNLLHFITLRDDAHAQAEIQEYSRAIKEICKELFPWTMEIYEKYKFKLVEV